MITVCVSSNQSAIYIYIWTEKERNHVYLEIMEYGERMGFRLTLIRNLRVFFSFDNNKVPRSKDCGRLRNFLRAIENELLFDTT